MTDRARCPHISTPPVHLAHIRCERPAHPPEVACVAYGVTEGVRWHLSWNPVRKRSPR